mmetsp:Transcript_9600/g.17540  ORF Transcript_9600/g.17540 Transcript_9600/m.17540 type:complete len:531 (+) Transcript_9600:68-1660(+)
MMIGKGCTHVALMGVLGLGFVFTKVHSAPIQKRGKPIFVTDFGALGDGQNDDTTAIQTAIDFSRNNSKTLHFPAGTYRITKFLDWGCWNGISVRGGEPNMFFGTVEILADPNVNGTAIHDFTGSAWGSIEGIAFKGGNATTQILWGRTNATFQNKNCATYGSDVKWKNCDIDGGFVSHMGEVLSWENCRFHSNGGVNHKPGLLITYRADTHWGFHPPSGRVFTNAVTLTRFMFVGGELTGDHDSLLILDGPGDGASINGASGTDWTMTGTYFASTGPTNAVKVIGNWTDLVLDGIRWEDDDQRKYNGQSFIKLVDGALIQNCRVHSYSDGDSEFPVISGKGDIHACDIISNAWIDVDGDVKLTSIRSTDQLKLKATGDVQISIQTDGIDHLITGGDLSADDGSGGVLVHRNKLMAEEEDRWLVTDGLYQVKLGSGAHMLVQVFGETTWFQKKKKVVVLSSHNTSFSSLELVNVRNDSEEEGEWDTESFEIQSEMKETDAKLPDLANKTAILATNKHKDDEVFFTVRRLSL